MTGILFVHIGAEVESGAMRIRDLRSIHYGYETSNGTSYTRLSPLLLKNAAELEEKHPDHAAKLLAAHILEQITYQAHTDIKGQPVKNGERTFFRDVPLITKVPQFIEDKINQLKVRAAPPYFWVVSRDTPSQEI